MAPSPDYRFNAGNNIEPGAAYLIVLTYGQLNGVDDRASRDFCAIAG